MVRLLSFLLMLQSFLLFSNSAWWLQPGCFVHTDSFIQPNKYWFYSNYTNLTGPPSFISAEVYWTDSDTTVGTHSYTKLHRSSLALNNPSPSFPYLTVKVPYVFVDTTLAGLLREDIAAQKVWYLPSGQHPCGSDEFELFDFSLQPDDTLSDCLLQMMDIWVPEPVGIITAKDTQVVTGAPRTILHFTGITPAGLTTATPMQLVEGIGFNVYCNFSGTMLPLFDGVCVGNLWECNITSSAWPEVEEKWESVYPNPTTGSLCIPNLQANDQIIFLNQFGDSTFIISKNSGLIDTSVLPAGIYMLIVRNESSTQKKALVVKI